MNEINKKRFFTQLTTTQLYLMIGNFLLVFFLIMLSDLGILPLQNISDFLFFTFLFLFFALYRPGWAFLLFVGTIALEKINFAPASFGITMRLYQFSGALVILAMLIRLVAKRLNFSLEKPKWYDILIIFIVASSFVSALSAADHALSFKLSVVFATFAALYFLVRNYIRDIMDLKKIIPFFLSSSLIVILYGIWQNVRFSRGLIAFEVMPGRPNATFPEADWLGIFLVFLIAVVYAVIFYYGTKLTRNDTSEISNFQTPTLPTDRQVSNKIPNHKFQKFVPYLVIILSYILLILTVSRSAWLGAAAATFIFLFSILTNLKFNPKFWRWKDFGVNLAGIAISAIIVVAVVYFFNLTSFQLFNRVQSTGSGLQKITIACSPRAELSEVESLRVVGDVSELEKFGCRHINLEDIEKEIGLNNIVKEIYHSDPNINIRKEIYAKSWQAIKKNPVLGIGWGSIGKVLGTDERGASLNASNIFLEVWLGAGMTGFLAFLAVWVLILIRVVLIYIKTDNFEEKAFTIFVISTWLGLTVSNLFNSGIMLGFFWLFLAAAMINLKNKSPE